MSNMGQEEEQCKKRIRELARKSWEGNCYTFTGFLQPAELSCFYEIERELDYAAPAVFGGMEDTERAMIRFGSEELTGYREEFPIACLLIRPVLQKFADQLTHRDFLGALMNLGIERTTMGDILIRDNQAYLFCLDTMADYITENLKKVKHTQVVCERTLDLPAPAKADGEEMRIQAASERLDGVIARVFHLSRSDAAECFRQKRVFVNGRLCENGSRSLKQEDRVSLRGSGKFIYRGLQGVSKKGKQNINVWVYGK